MIQSKYQLDMRLKIVCIRTSSNLQNLFDPNKMRSKVPSKRAGLRFLIFLIDLKTRYDLQVLLPLW